MDRDQRLGEQRKADGAVFDPLLDRGSGHADRQAERASIKRALLFYNTPSLFSAAPSEYRLQNRKKKTQGGTYRLLQNPDSQIESGFFDRPEASFAISLFVAAQEPPRCGGSIKTLSLIQTEKAFLRFVFLIGALLHGWTPRQTELNPSSVFNNLPAWRLAMGKYF